jgi:hypothetical protein
MSTDPTSVPAPARKQRRAARYPVAVDITFDGGTGRTRDISAVGVYFATTAVLSPGECLAFQVEARHFQMPSPMTVRCRCRVVRVESQEGSWGVAAAIDDIQFDRPAQETEQGTPPPAQTTPLPLT